MPERSNPSPRARARCLNCGWSMIEVGCKVRCPRCNVFYDCSDGMLPMPEAEPTRAEPQPEPQQQPRPSRTVSVRGDPQGRNRSLS